MSNHKTAPEVDWHSAYAESLIFTTEDDGTQRSVLAEVPEGGYPKIRREEIAEFIANAINAHILTPAGKREYNNLKIRHDI